MRIGSITGKVQRKSEGSGINRTTRTRRSLQPSSKKDNSPFGELYEMLKSSVKASKENSETPVRESGSSPKNVRRNFEAVVSQSPAPARRSQSSDSATVRGKDTKGESRSLSADQVRDRSKSPSKGPRNSLTKQKQGGAVNTPNTSNKWSRDPDAQTPRRRSANQGSASPPQATAVSPAKQSPRRSRNAEEIQAAGLVSSPAGSKRRGSRGQSMENQENSPLSLQSPKGKRSSSKGTPTKPTETEEKANEAVQGNFLQGSAMFGCSG